MHLKTNLGHLLIAAIISYSLNVQAQDSPLTFKFPPEIIQNNAKSGKFLPIKIVSKTLELKEFNVLLQRAAKNNKGGIYIGVIVDNYKKNNWGNEFTMAHIRNIQKHATMLTRGDSKNHKPSFAERYGARIALIFPISYSPKDRYNYIKKTAEGKELQQHPVKVNDILIAINDHDFLKKKGGFFPNTVDELESALDKSFQKGMHTISSAIYIKKLRQELAVLDEEIEVLDHDIKKDDQDIKKLDQELDELNEVKSAFKYLDSNKDKDDR
jgi:hypothetical protein